jgi:hypothetical protein
LDPAVVECRQRLPHPREEVDRLAVQLLGGRLVQSGELGLREGDLVVVVEVVVDLAVVHPGDLVERGVVTGDGGREDPVAFGGVPVCLRVHEDTVHVETDCERIVGHRLSVVPTGETSTGEGSYPVAGPTPS